MVPFAGYSMPVQYDSVIAESKAVRERAGMFDVSHMGRLRLMVKRALEFLERVTTNDVAKIPISDGHYSLLPNSAGGVVDDIILYKISDEDFGMVVNASNHDKDVAWLQDQNQFDVVIRDDTDETAMIAVQGPKAVEILAGLAADGDGLRARDMFGTLNTEIAGVPCFAARSGYTGEDGFEIFLSHHDGLELWRQLVAAGAKPCGLGARDTLRLEMGYPLNGSDLEMNRTPLEAGLEKFVSLDDPQKGSFIGRDALEKQRAAGLKFSLTPLKLVAGGPPLRSHYSIYHGETLLGETTSGAFSPSLGEGIAMAYLPIEWNEVGKIVEIEVRGRRYQAAVTTLPFYRIHSGQTPLKN